LGGSVVRCRRGDGRRCSRDGRHAIVVQDATEDILEGNLDVLRQRVHQWHQRRSDPAIECRDVGTPFDGECALGQDAARQRHDPSGHPRIRGLFDIVERCQGRIDVHLCLLRLDRLRCVSGEDEGETDDRRNGDPLETIDPSSGGRRKVGPDVWGRFGGEIRLAGGSRLHRRRPCHDRCSEFREARAILHHGIGEEEQLWRERRPARRQ